MTLAEKVKLGIALLLIGGVFVLGVCSGRKIGQRERATEDQREQQLQDRARELNAPKSIVVPKIVPRGGAAATVRKLQLVDKGVKPVEEVEATALLTPPPVPVPVPETVTWDDPHHRFHLFNGQFSRKQEFSITTTVVESSAGTKNVITDFRELDPETHQPITDEPQPVISTAYRVVSDRPEMAVFHPRVVAAVGYLGQVGLGVELLNLERFGGVWKHANLSVIGVYNLSDKKVEGAGVLGFRPFNWNLSVGPAYFFPGNAFGAAATLELTR